MKPRLLNIVWTDWPSLFCFIMVPMIWLMVFTFPLRYAAVRKFEILTLGIPPPY